MNFSSKLKDGTDFEHKIEVAGWGATTKFGREPASVLQWLAVNVTDFQACKVMQLTVLPSFGFVAVLGNKWELRINFLITRLRPNHAKKLNTLQELYNIYLQGIRELYKNVFLFDYLKFL